MNRVLGWVNRGLGSSLSGDLESQEEDDPKCILWFKSMSWLGQIRPHRRYETWSASLWQTFFTTSVAAHIPFLAEMPLSACGCRKFQIDPLGDHLCTCTTHSGVKKADDWVVDQIADLFRTTHKVKTQQVSRSRGQTRLRQPKRFGWRSDPSINWHLHYPNDVDRSLNETVVDKIRQYRADYNNRTSNAISFMPPIPSTSGRWRSEFVRLLFFQAHRETDRFFADSVGHLAQHDRDQFHHRRVAFSSQLKSKVGNIRITKAATLRITLNIDGAPLTSKSHTHPSHSQTSRLLISSLSLGVPVPRATQCMWGV
jgi:hypothetical protein